MHKRTRALEFPSEVRQENMGQGRRALRFVRLPVRHAERPLYTALSGRTWNRRKRRDALFSVSRPIRQWRWTGADKSGNPGISSIQISRLGRGPAKIPEIHMSCPICKKIGETPSGHSVVRCKAFDHQAVCMQPVWPASTTENNAPPTGAATAQQKKRRVM